MPKCSMFTLILMPILISNQLNSSAKLHVFSSFSDTITFNIIRKYTDIRQYFQSLVDLAPKYILEQFMEAELMVNITEHEVGFL